MTTTQETRSPITPAEERELEKEFYDSQPMRSECGLCGWFYEGEAAAVRERAAEHRQERHPEVASKRRSRRSARRLNSFRSPDMSERDLKEIDDERRRRAFLIGIEIEE